MDAATVVAVGTFLVSGLWMLFQARNLRDAAARATEAMKGEASRFERSIAFEREKFQAESQRWREEKRDAKRAEVAAHVLLTIQKFLMAMDSIGSAWSTGTDHESKVGPTAEGERVRNDATRKRFTDRWKGAQPTFDSFNEAWDLSNVYLPSEVSALCDELWKFRAHVWANQASWLAHLGQYMVGDRAFAEGVGKKVHDRADELRKRALAMLRPHAQLHHDPNEQPVATAPARVRVEVPEVDMSPEAEPLPGVATVDIADESTQRAASERSRRDRTP